MSPQSKNAILGESAPHTQAALKPGDMLGFSPPWYDPLGAMINLGSLGIPGRGLAHVGIVADYSPPMGVMPHDEVPHLYESTTTVHDMPCRIRGKVVSGVQCHPVAERVRGYAGTCWHYPLRRPLRNREARLLAYRLGNLCVEACPYDAIGALRSRSMLVAAVMRAKFGRENLKELFCSELVAHQWAKLNILETKNASRWNPNALARYAVRHGLVDEPRRLSIPEAGKMVRDIADEFERPDEAAGDLPELLKKAGRHCESDQCHPRLTPLTEAELDALVEDDVRNLTTTIPVVERIPLEYESGEVDQ